MAGSPPSTGRRGGEEVEPAVVVEVDQLDVRCLRRQPDEARRLGHVAEARPPGLAAFVQVEAHRNPPIPLERAVEVLTEHEVGPAVAVHVARGDAGDVVLLAERAPLELVVLDLAEAPVAAVHEQPVRAAHEEVRQTVAGEVGGGDPEPGDVARATRPRP